MILAAVLLWIPVPDSAAHAQSGTRTGGCPVSSANLHVFQEGEELLYEVSYLGMGLGSIRTRVTAVDTTKGRRRFAAECLIRTYHGVPFITLNTLFQSVMGDSLESVFFRNKEYFPEESAYKYIEYTFPKQQNRVFITETFDNNPDWRKQDTLQLEGKRWQDGLSLFFFARALSHTSSLCHVPVLMYFTKATTTVHFGVEKEEEDIDAVDYDIRCRKLEGETGFTGIFGLTGGFEGWFSDDAAAIPIRAKMHVLIGSVHIELIKWKRKGWSPPRASD